MDTDFHKIIDVRNVILNKDMEIVIGNNVWIGCRCTILKGTYIGNDIVIAANSCLYNKININNAIIGGNPYKILHKNIIWKI